MENLNPVPQQNLEEPSESKWVKVLRVVYVILAVLVSPFALFSLFIFDGSDLMLLRWWVFLSAFLVPGTLIAATVLTKRSLLWFLLPWVFVVSFFVSSSVFDSEFRQSNIDFCKRQLEIYPSGSYKDYCQKMLEEGR